MLPAARLLRAFCCRSRMKPAWQARVIFAILLGSLSAYASSSPFDRAQRQRAALEARPESQRTQVAYTRVLDAYRAIYQGNPASPKADASVFAVAELLAEEGRVFSDQKRFHDAIDQYEILSLQYPASQYRYSALFAEGEIYRHDLVNRDQAKKKFQQFLKVYPQHPLAEQAKLELNEIHQEEHPTRAARHSAEKNGVLAAAIGSQQYATPSRPPPAVTTPAIQPAQQAAVPEEAQPTSFAPLHPGQVSLVSGIRHWSTPVYTRIAIDLQNQVSYQAARVPGPDRIYFDLYGARLDPALNGRSVEVIDDGFLKRIRAAQFSNNVTRIVLDVSSVSDYSAFLLPNPWRLIIDIHGLKPGTAPTTNLASLPPAAAARSASTSTNSQPAQPPVVNQPPAPSVVRRTAATQDIASLGTQPNRVQATDHPTTRPIAASVAGTVPAPQADDGSLASPTPPPVTSHKKPSAMHPAPPAVVENDDNPAPPMHEAEPTAAGERSLVRTLGLKIGRIVIDAGHGGHDSGTTGPGGIEEKQVVLDVALRLGKLLKQRLGADVIYTRDDDTFIPLETRTAIANKAQADLFLSIHANSSPDSSARGVETYYLNFTTSPDALEVAARENAVSDESIHELSDLVKKITLKDKIDESREFAADVQKSLYTDLEEGNPGLRDRGIKKAPFVVLIGANMPSILAEISFLTNSDDARELQQPAYRQRIAESLYRGVSRYISGLSGVRLAQNSSRPNGN